MPGRALGVPRPLGIVPILGRIAFADGEVDIVGELLGVAREHLIAARLVTVSEFAGLAVEGAELPQQPAVGFRRPRERAGANGLVSGDGEAGLRQVVGLVGAIDIEGVFARHDIIQCEGAICADGRPIVVALGLGGPGDFRVGVGQDDLGILGRGATQQHLPGYRATRLDVFRGGHKAIGPLAALNGQLMVDIVPQGVGIAGAVGIDEEGAIDL